MLETLIINDILFLIICINTSKNKNIIATRFRSSMIYLQCVQTKESKFQPLGETEPGSGLYVSPQAFCLCLCIICIMYCIYTYVYSTFPVRVCGIEGRQREATPTQTVNWQHPVWLYISIGEKCIASLASKG